MLRLLLLTFLVLIASFSHGQMSQLRKCAPAMRIAFVVKRFGWANDGATLNRQMDSVMSFAREQHDEKLYHYTHLVFTKVRASKDTTVTERLKIYNHEQAYFEHCGEAEVTGAYYLWLGQEYYDQHDFAKAFHYIILADDLFETVGYKNLALANNYTIDLFNFYYHFEDYPTAIKYLKLNLTVPDISSTPRIFILNDIGVSYLRMKDYANAAAWFQTTMRESRRIGDSIYTAIGSSNYGHVLKQQGRYKEALPYLYFELPITNKIAPENCAITCLHIAYCLLQLDSVRKAGDYIKRSLTFNPNWYGSFYWLYYYETKALYYQKTNNYLLAALYEDTLVRVKDSLRNLFSTRILMATSLREKDIKLLQEKKKAEHEEKDIRLVRNVIVTGLILTFVVVVLVMNMKRKREKRLAEEKQRKAEEQIKLANAQLEQYLQNLREKSAFIEKMEAELHAMQASGVQADIDNHLQELYNSVILTEENWVTFKDLFERVWPGFFKRVNAKFPDLSRGEERLLALCKLNISSREMADMIGISVDSLRKSRYRLRQKYPSLLEDEEFGELV